MNKIVVVGDHYAAEASDGRVVAVVCRSLSGESWAIHAVVPDPIKSEIHYCSLDHALKLAKDWAT